MTAEGLGSRGGRRGRRLLLVGSTTLALAAGAACASEAELPGVSAGDGEFEATPEFLADAARRSSGEAYRLEMDLAMELALLAESVDVDWQVMSGELEGERYEMTMDLGPMFEAIGEVAPMPPALGDADLTVEMAGAADVMYLRAPLFEAIADMGGGAAPGGPLGDLARLGSDWGRVDLTRLGDGSPLNDVASAAGVQAADPRAFLELVAGADEVEELGDSQVRGVAVNGLAAEATLGEVLEASGDDPELYTERNELPSDALEVPLPIEVWIDGDGLVRRIAYEMDLGELVEASEEAGTVTPDTFSAAVTLDFFDYGDDSIAIELPDPDEAVDVTGFFLELYGGSQT